MSFVIALAGTRIDEPDATQIRFPPENEALVRNRLRKLFKEFQTKTLVCSAACGADLLALEAAEELGIPSRIVLPFDAETFRKTSVADRPGNWGERFDRLYAASEKRGAVVILKPRVDPYDAYLLANERILTEAESMSLESGVSSRESKGRSPDSRLHTPDSRLRQVLVVIVWDGASRGSDDITAKFADAGRARGFKIVEVLTK
ncbi:MAG TPA: hypothetical protein VJM12_17355 [Pyrinomonadaceae bacterium]|nr:hypothetical protein [Pyrinomonadaceae bacterium]